MQPYDHGGDVYTGTPIALDFSVNTNPLGIPAAVKDALTGELDHFKRYPDPHCRALRAALAAHHGVAENRILCGNGAADLIFRLCACLQPATALTPAPTFSEYERPVKLFGGGVRTHPLREEDGFALTETILDRIRPDVDLLFLCNPNNPTGRLADRRLLEEILCRCRELGVPVLLDECFTGFTQAESCVPLLDEYPNLLILRAFTKLYAMAGLRLGYLLGDVELLGRIERFGAQWSVSVPAQTAGVAALTAEPEWSRETRTLIRQEREFLRGGFAELGLMVFPSDANFLLIKSREELHLPLLQKGILTRSCANFTGLDARYIRVAVRSRAENEQLLKAVREVLYFEGSFAARSAAGGIEGTGG